MKLQQQKLKNIQRNLKEKQTYQKKLGRIILFLYLLHFYHFDFQ